MTDIDQNKLHLIDEAISWLQNAKKYHAAWQHQVADDCLVKAKVALSNPAFSRQVIPGFPRNQQPETVKILTNTLLGYAIIDGSDFNPEVHQLYVEEPKATGKPRAKQS